ncbi:MAG TPA: thermonuclease family protein [Hyphomicrobiales bacterium]|nr:thermonuclease family protein [Hyphomicrobiales bacterium]
MATRKSRKKSAWRLPKTWLSLLIVVALASAYEYTTYGAVTWPQDLSRTVRETIVGWQSPTPIPRDAPPATTTSETAATSTANVPVAPPAYDLAGRVVSVADGDTFTLRLPGQRDFRIRLYGIDAPERDQPYGKQASNTLNDTLLGKDVFLVLEDVDNYGRLVATVYAGGDNVNLSLVRQGLAWWYTDYAAGNRELEAAQRTARGASQGLWKDSNPVPPWDWRRR